MTTTTTHRHPAVIESEHRDTLTVVAFKLDELAREHAEARGYLTACARAWHEQAKTIREFLRES